jgi:cobalt/nickel transport system permease protein
MGSGHVHAAPLSASYLGGLDARAKLAAFIPAIAFVNLLPHAHWRLIAAVGGLFAALLATCGHGAGAILRRGLLMLPFVAFVVVTLPFSMPGSKVFSIDVGFSRLVVTDEGLVATGEVLLKATVSILGALLLAGTTEAPKLFAGLRSLGAPKAFVTVLSMIYRYLFQTADEFSKVRRAAAARCFTMRGVGSARRLGNMAASLLVRSVERSERVHHAMLARGYDGEVRTLHHGHFGAREWAFVVGFATVIAAAGAIALYA